MTIAQQPSLRTQMRETKTYWDDNDASLICHRSLGPGGVAAASVCTQQAPALRLRELSVVPGASLEHTVPTSTQRCLCSFSFTSSLHYEIIFFLCISR